MKPSIQPFSVGSAEQTPFGSPSLTRKMGDGHHSRPDLSSGQKFDDPTLNGDDQTQQQLNQAFQIPSSQLVDETLLAHQLR